MNRPSQPQAGLQRYRAIVSYDGSRFAGWQIQPDVETLQGELQRALYDLTRERRIVHASGRTDTGVHARGQVIHFDLERRMPLRNLHLGLLAKLPEEIRVRKVARAAPDFHARRSAVGKQYRYFIWNDPVACPWLRHVRTHVRPRLDVAAMNRAAAQLVGRHDFQSFSANPSRVVESTVRDLRRLSVTRKGPEITIVAEADGFLYKMVRSLSGFLLRVGAGELDPDVATLILASAERTARVPTAPPQGLFLWKVFYPEGRASRRSRS